MAASTDWTLRSKTDSDAPACSQSTSLSASSLTQEAGASYREFSYVTVILQTVHLKHVDKIIARTMYSSYVSWESGN